MTQGNDTSYNSPAVSWCPKMSLKSHLRFLPFLHLLKLRSIFKYVFWNRWRSKPHHNPTSWRQSLKILELSELASFCPLILSTPLHFCLSPSLSLFGPQRQRVELFVLLSHAHFSTFACPWLCFYFILLFSSFILGFYSQSPLLPLWVILRCYILIFACISEEYIVFMYFQFTYVVLAIGCVLFLFNF